MGLEEAFHHFLDMSIQGKDISELPSGFYLTLDLPITLALAFSAYKTSDKETSVVHKSSGLWDLSQEPQGCRQ